MPTLLGVLEKLPLADIKGLAEAAGVQVADKRKAALLADALTDLDPAHHRLLHVDLSRDILKRACRALRLDDSGRSRSVQGVRWDLSWPVVAVGAPSFASGRHRPMRWVG